MKEIIELVQILQEMSTDTYLRCKYIMQAVGRKKDQRTEDFVDKLFCVADSRRPLLIEMKEIFNVSQNKSIV